jgi:hypothetical protein
MQLAQGHSDINSLAIIYSGLIFFRVFPCASVAITFFTFHAFNNLNQEITP